MQPAGHAQVIVADRTGGEGDLERQRHVRRRAVGQYEPRRAARRFHGGPNAGGQRVAQADESGVFRVLLPAPEWLLTADLTVESMFQVIDFRRREIVEKESFPRDCRGHKGSRRLLEKNPLPRLDRAERGTLLRAIRRVGHHLETQAV